MAFFLKLELFLKLLVLKPDVLLCVMVKIMVTMFIMGNDWGNRQWPKDFEKYHY